MSHHELPLLLYIEDNQDDFEATMRSFKKVNFNNPVKWCKSGNDALDFLRKEGVHKSANPKEIPSLILLDLNMPGIDGRQTLKIIKNDDNLKQIPVIILTTSADKNDVNICYELGASTYIQKPVNFENLIEAVKRIKDYWFSIAILPVNKE